MNIPSPSASAGVITTGLDVAAETRSFNEQLMSRVADQPALYEAPDSAAAIEAAREGSFTGAPRPRLDQARDRTVISPAGPVRVRVLGLAPAVAAEPGGGHAVADGLGVHL